MCGEKHFTLVISVAGTCATSQIPRFIAEKNHLLGLHGDVVIHDDIHIVVSILNCNYYYTYTIHTVHMFAIIWYTF